MVVTPFPFFAHCFPSVVLSLVSLKNKSGGDSMVSTYNTEYVITEQDKTHLH